MAEEAARALEGGEWTAGLRVAPAKPADEAPLLDSARIKVSFRSLSAFAERLARAAAKGAPRNSAAGSLKHSIPDSDELADLLARYIGGQSVAGGGIASLVAFIAVPILAACSKQLGVLERRAWSRGYCFLCGAWASLGELRGIDRSRHLRCARCGSDWVAPPLRCIYCGESDHRKLGFLELEGELETRKVETCSTCGGYLKSLATLAPLSMVELLIWDLENVELDLAALERGYKRPGVVGYSFSVALVDGSRADGAF